MSALMISRFNVKDGNKFAEYMTATKKIAVRFGAEAVFSGSINRQLNGIEPLNQVVVVRFPDTEAINNWFDSDAYRQLQALREQSADMTMISYE